MTIHTTTLSIATSSSIDTTGILPSYYDSAPNIVITETTTLKIAAAIPQKVEEQNEQHKIQQP